MGIQDRDYWWDRDGGRRNPRTSAQRGAASRAGRPGGRRTAAQQVPAWMLWWLGGCAVVLAIAFVARPDRAGTPFPATGQVHWYAATRPEPLAPLTLVAPQATPGNFVVTLDDWETGRAVAMIPVRSGQTARVSVPLGRYRLGIVKGFMWRGPGPLFRFTTASRQSVEPLDFYRVGNRITGHTIQLESVTGNMPTMPAFR